MKILSLIMMVLVLSCSTAQARPGPGAPHHAPSPLHMPQHGWHRPVPVRPPHHRPGEPIGAFLAGLVGAVIGNYVVSDVYQPNTFANKRCFTMVSQLDGRMVRKCVSVQDWTYRPQSEIYNILYID